MKTVRRFLIDHLRPEQITALRQVKARVGGLMRGHRSVVEMNDGIPEEKGLLRLTRGHRSVVQMNYGIPGEESRLGLLWPWNHEVSRLARRLPSGRSWPRVSVVTVTYNQGQFLEETIRSVLLQGYPNLEYIIVDGGSIDNTRRVLERYRSEVSVIISEPDRGQSDALNKGFRHATGDILAWLNSDDQYFPGTLARVARAFDEHRTDMVIGGTALVRSFERMPHTVHHCMFPIDEVIDLPLAQLADFDHEWQKGKFFFQPEVFWTRELWERSGARVADEFRYAMDYELWLRFASHRARAVHIPDPVAIFRLHDAQKTKWRDGEEYPEHRAVGRLYGKRPPAQSGTTAEKDGAPGAPDLTDISATIPKSVFDRRPVLSYSTEAGTFFLPVDAVQDEAAAVIRSGGTHREDLIRLAESQIVPGSVVLDVGGGFGQGAVIFSRRAGRNGQVLAFEADEYVYDILQRNIVANQRQNIRAFLGVVFDGSRQRVGFPRREYLRFPSYSTQRVDLSRPGMGEVECFSIDDLSVEAPISLLYVHTQGSELAILKGACETISRHRMPILLDFDEELHADLGYTRADFDRFLADANYEIVQTAQSYTHLAFPKEWSPTRSPSVGQLHAPRSLDQTARAAPNVRLTSAPFRASLCKILKSRDEIDQSTRFLKRNGFVSHNLTCKDWDLAHIIPEIGDGNLLDMGSSDSYVLKNVCLKRTHGEKHGIDLQQPDVPLEEVKYTIGNLMDTKLPSQHFAYITCLSVLEHQVDFQRFAREVRRLLQPGGKLFVTFDYWEPLVVPPVKLYGLDWQPLDAARTAQLISTLSEHGLKIVQDFEWSQGDPVIRWGYYSPHSDMKYTFALAVFEKLS